MSSTSLCRLCICTYTECEKLFDESGQGNDVYEITIKYFDPMFLNYQQHPQLSMDICIECWRQINDFHTFQQSILNAHTKLDHEFKQIINNIKIEEPIIIGTQTPNETELCHGVFNNTRAEVDVKNEILSDIDMCEIKDEDPFTNCESVFPQSLPKTTRKNPVTNPKMQEIIDEDDVLVKSKIKTTNKNSTECMTQTKTSLKLKIPNELDDSLNIKKEIEAENATEHDDVNTKNNSRCSNQSSNYFRDYSASDNNYLQADSDASVTTTNETNTQKTRKIDAFIAEWKQTLECELCKQSFATFTLLKKHFSIEHPKQECYVTCCERKLKHLFDIVEHIKLHMDPNTFKRLKTDLLHVQDRPFACAICQKRFVKKWNLKAHMEIHDNGKDYECSECDKGFCTEQRRNIHERKVHKIGRVCDQCGKTIHGAIALKQHMLEHDGIKQRKWRCSQCNLELNSRHRLNCHKKTAHHDGSTAYVCTDCGKIASSESALRSHKKYVHQAERKFKCSICDKGFKFAIVLREHMATHTGEDLYQCSYCPKKFRVNSNMNHHRKKAHPKECAEAKLKKQIMKKVDVNLVLNEIAI